MILSFILAVNGIIREHIRTKKFFRNDHRNVMQDQESGISDQYEFRLLL